ncbi:hypothetical protein [Methylomonas sp. HYX-M1]|uniref:hypothetical protein n=1 Tax=Methylomonas sp. HYX-M1 TaxID=3139307 RepID=UPI00345BE7A7
METWQKLVPVGQDLWQQWYQLTLHNREYAVALVVCAVLVTAIFYSIRIGFLKSAYRKLEQARAAAQAELEEAGTHVAALQQQIAQLDGELQQAKLDAQAQASQAASNAESLSRRNKQLAESAASLTECFELSVEKLPAADAAHLPEAYAAILNRAAERFRNELQAKAQLQLSLHAEATKTAEKEMLANGLQDRLNIQTQQLAKLELELEQLQHARQQWEADKQRLTTEIQGLKAQAALAQASASVPAAPPAPTIAVGAELEPVAVNTLADLDDGTVKQESATADWAAGEEVVSPKAPMDAEPVNVMESRKEDDGPRKGLFARAMSSFSKIDGRLGMNTAADVEELQTDAVLGEVPAISAEELSPISAAASVETSAVAKNSGIFGMFNQPAIPEETPTLPIQAAEPAKPDTQPKGKGFFARTLDSIAKIDEKLGMKPDMTAVEAEQPARVETLAATAVQSEADAADKTQAFGDGVSAKLGGLLGGFGKPVRKKNAQPAEADERIELADNGEAAKKASLSGWMKKLKPGK